MINETNKQSWCVNAEHAIGANNDGSTKMCCMIKNIESMVIGQHTIAKNFNKKTFSCIGPSTINALAQTFRS